MYCYQDFIHLINLAIYQLKVSQTHQCLNILPFAASLLNNSFVDVFKNLRVISVLFIPFCCFLLLSFPCDHLFECFYCEKSGSPVSKPTQTQGHNLTIVLGNLKE